MRFLLSFLIFISHVAITNPCFAIPVYPSIKNHEKRWHHFHTKIAKEFRTFVSKHAALSKVSIVFYPFGGADILYPFMVFPNATSLVIVGLENLGTIPLSMQKKNKDLPDDAPELSKDVESLLRRSFFITSSMQKNYHQSEGVLGAILEQLALLGVKVVECEQTLQDVGLTFMYKKLKRHVRYVKKNLSNHYDIQDFLKILLPIQGVLLKSTSYTLHTPQFREIRRFILENADVIFQDDSGIPLKYFSSVYDVRKYGHYTKPYGKEWEEYIQKDLQTKTSLEKNIPFCFGYGCMKQPPVILIAYRKS